MDVDSLVKTRFGCASVDVVQLETEKKDAGISSVRTIQASSCFNLVVFQNMVQQQQQQECEKTRVRLAQVVTTCHWLNKHMPVQPIARSLPIHQAHYFKMFTRPSSIPLSLASQILEGCAREYGNGLIDSSAHYLGTLQVDAWPVTIIRAAEIE